MKPDTPKFALVPEQYTPDMLEAMADAYHEVREAHAAKGEEYRYKFCPLDWFPAGYKAMLAAAPKPDCVGVEEIEGLDEAIRRFHNGLEDFDDRVTMLKAARKYQNLLTVKDNPDAPPSDLSKREGE